MPLITLMKRGLQFHIGHESQPKIFPCSFLVALYVSLTRCQQVIELCRGRGDCWKRKGQLVSNLHLCIYLFLFLHCVPFPTFHARYLDYVNAIIFACFIYRFVYSIYILISFIYMLQVANKCFN